MRIRRLCLCAVFLVLCAGVSVPAQEKKAKPKVHPRVTPEMLEGVLKGLELTFKKETEKEGVHGYVFQRGDTRIRLVNYDGGDLWIEVVFDKKLPLERVNEWNATAKYSRCVLLDNEAKSTTSLEMQLDCINGVTEGMVRQFLVRFGGELKEFVKFIGK